LGIPHTRTHEEAILLQFRQVSKKQQEIADAVGVTQKTVDNRLESLVNLDRCPKLLKIAALFEEAMVLPDLDKCPKSTKIAAPARRR
jgi:DNA-binding XRE family transcriptional regulator